MNTIDFDEKNGSTIWEDASKTELKPLNDYQTFMLLDTGKLYLVGIRKKHIL
jgi:hypothetical protein